MEVKGKLKSDCEGPAWKVKGTKRSTLFFFHLVIYPGDHEISIDRDFSYSFLYLYRTPSLNVT